MRFLNWSIIDGQTEDRTYHGMFIIDNDNEVVNKKYSGTYVGAKSLRNFNLGYDAALKHMLEDSQVDTKNELFIIQKY